MVLFFYREEKSEALAEMKDELEHNRSLVTKLKAEVCPLQYLNHLLGTRSILC